MKVSTRIVLSVSLCAAGCSTGEAREPHPELTATRAQAAEIAPAVDAFSWRAEDQFVARVGPIPAGVLADSTTGREAVDTDVAVDDRSLAVAYAWEDAVYTYVWNGEIWVLQQKLVPPDDITPPPSLSYGFGESLSVSGDSLIVAATGWDLTSGAAHIYRRVGAHWARPQRLPTIIWTASFGSSVSISGDTAVVGTIGENGSAAGAAYVFVDNGEKWTLQQRLTNDKGSTPGGELHLPYFGANVSLDGDTLAVGRLEGLPGEQTAWLFVRRGSSWRLQQTLVGSADDSIVDSSVALALHGDIVVTGLQQFRSWSGPTRGEWLPLRMRVFTRRGSEWHSQTTLAPERPPRPGGAQFNFDVALSQDTIVYAKDSGGNSFIYNRTAGGWTEQRVPPFDPESKDVENVAVNQRTALLGPSVFARHGSSWRHTQQLKFRSRRRVGTSWPPPPIYAVSATDEKVAIATTTGSGEAQAEIYARNGSVWGDEAQLKIPAGTTNASVALSGNRLLLSPLPATGSTGARAFTQRAGSTPEDATSGWSEEHEFKAANGTPIAGAVSLSLDTALIGVPERGLAHVFVRGDTGWTEQATLQIAELPAGARFGASVSIFGNVAVVGAPQAEQDLGAAYVFVRSGSSWTHVQKLTPTNVTAPARFGYSVSVSEDVILIGAPAAGERASGTTFEFVRQGSSWNQSAGTIHGDPAAAHFFGSALSIAGNTAAIAAHGADPAAYIFVKADGVWVRQRKIASMGTSDERIGTSVSVARGTLAIGGTRSSYVFGRRTPREPGQDCSSRADCTTGVCSDGVCCNRACDGTCESCVGMLTGAADGTCLNVLAGTRCGPDPHTCTAGGEYAVMPTCNANGHCTTNSSECAEGFACAGNADGGYCVLDCAESGTYDHSLCRESHWCRRDPAGGAGGICVPDLRGGGPCESSQQCTSGQCSGFWCRGAQGDRCQSQADCATSLTCRDGFCCNTACPGTCEACNVSGREGTCTPKDGQPEPGHGACQGAQTNCEGPCAACAGRCDGRSPECFYPGAAQECAPATCSGARLTPAAQCDGAGRCAARTAEACPNLFGCDESATCKTRCASHADCANGARCKPDTGECMLPGAECDDAYTVRLPNGAVQSCQGHLCIAEGQCAQGCSDDNQCAPTHACNSGRCKERSSPKPDAGAHADGGTDDGGSTDGDCSCRAAGLRSASNSSGRALGLAALVLGLSTAMRRRRASVAARSRSAGSP